MSLQTVEITQDDDIVTLRLNRPDAANAVDLQMARDLLTAAEHCATTPGVRAVVLTGKGKMFSGGGDVPAFVAAGDGAGALLRDITTPLHAAIARLVRMDAPLVVAVNGTAVTVLGGGCSGRNRPPHREIRTDTSAAPLPFPDQGWQDMNSPTPPAPCRPAAISNKPSRRPSAAA